MSWSPSSAISPMSAEVPTVRLEFEPRSMMVNSPTLPLVDNRIGSHAAREPDKLAPTT